MKIAIFNHGRFFAAGFCLLVGIAAAQPADKNSASNVPSAEALAPRGTFVTMTVPATLDLQDNAEAAVNVLTGNLIPEKFYSLYQAFDFDTTETKGYGVTWNLTPEFLGALPLLRNVCGTTAGLEIERRAMSTLLDQVSSDGLMFYPLVQDGAAKDTSYPQVNATFALALANWYERDKNPEWLKVIERIAAGLDKAAIKVDQRAFYPSESSIGHDGKWHWTEREGRDKAPIPYYPPNEPISDQQGLEGAVKVDHGKPIYALAKLASLKHESGPLDLADKLTRFVLKRGMWEETSGTSVPGYEHGVFAGHHHNNLATLLALLELGEVQKDAKLKLFVREAYNISVRHSVVRLGFFPAWVMPEAFNRDKVHSGMTEVCAVAEALMLAVRLSDAGMGDYWDDVDSIVRNHLVQEQILDIDKIAAKYGTTNSGMEWLKKFRGGFACATPSAICTPIYGCCTANGALSLCYAWNGITRFDGSVATVNLFLNRSAEWLDVESDLPYRGRVVLRNKKAETILVRIPAWVDRNGLTGTCNGKTVALQGPGAYVALTDAKPGDVFELQFAVPETVETYTINDKPYKITFRGSTVTAIDPHSTPNAKLELYQGGEKAEEKVPTRVIRRFVPSEVLPLQ